MKGGFLSGGMRRSATVPVSGIWLRASKPDGSEVQVLAEVNGEWKLIHAEKCDGPFSIIVEPGKIASSPRDPVTHHVPPARGPVIGYAKTGPIDGR